MVPAATEEARKSPSLAFATALAEKVSVLDLAYHAEAPGCPDASEFAAMVARQSSQASASGAVPLAVSLRLFADDGGFVGELVIRSSTAPNSRRIQAATCQQAAEALALVVALAHEQEEQERTAGKRVADSQQSPSQPIPAPVGKAEPAAIRRDARAHESTSSVLVGGSVTWAISPGMSPGFVLALERNLNPWVGLRVLGRYHAWADTESSAGQTSFRRWVGGGSVVARWPVLPSFTLRSAAEGQVGLYSATGSGDQGSRTADASWLSLGGWVGLRWAPGSLFVDLNAGAELPLRRPTVYFEPRRTVFRPPAVAANAELSLGLSFW